MQVFQTHKNESEEKQQAHIIIQILKFCKGIILYNF